MFSIFSPHPAASGAIILDNPELRDSEKKLETLIVRQTMSGNTYTQIKRLPNSNLFVWNFTLQRTKALELLDFFEEFSASLCLVTDHHVNTHIGYFKTNPLQLNMAYRAADCLDNDAVRVTLEFESVA